MNKIVSGFLVVCGFLYGLQLTGCNKSDSGTTNGNSSFKIPNVTGAVSTTAAQSLTSQRISSVNTSAANNFIGGTTPSASNYAFYPYMSGMMHFFLSKVPDVMGCLVEVLVSKGLVSTDGKEYIITDSDDNSKSKISVNASGTTFNSYKVYQCSASSSQTQYMSGSLTGEDLVFTFKNIESTSKSALSVTGKYNGTTWTSKEVSIYGYDSSTGYNSAYKTTQYADAMISQYSAQSSPSNIQIYAKYGLTGTTTQDYAMGAGSIKATTTSGAVVHWDSSFANTTTASAYSSDVSAGSYLTIPTSYTANDITGSEVWDCSTGSATVLDNSNITQSQAQEVSQGVQECMAGL